MGCRGRDLPALDRAAIERLIASLSRLLDPAAAATVTMLADLAFTGSCPAGDTHLLDQLWRRLGIDAAMGNLLGGRELDRV